MRHKVAELEGAQLDAAVAKAEGIEAIPGRNDVLLVWSQDDGVWRGWTPSRSWHDGGPIIERERITVVAFTGYDGDDPLRYIDEPLPGYQEDRCGPTPLIAAMRAYVASKLGEDVELP